MPLFQPSNITPSSFSGVGGGTVAVSENVNITWQVNGNVPMTAFKVNVYKADTNNTFVKSSGIIGLSKKIYPTDDKGNPTYYTYAPSDTSWQSWGLSDGEEYNLQITQWWGNDTTEESENKVTQFSQSSFKTRTLPTLSISTVKGDAVSETLRAKYSQAQNDSIDWVEWRFYESDEYGGSVKLLDDTGVVNTQVLKYFADNMQPNKYYKIVCTVQTESGIQVSASNHFLVDYEVAQAEGTFDISFPNRESNLLTWSAIPESSGISIQGESNDGRHSFNNGSLALPKGSTVTWDTQEENGVSSGLSIPLDWSLAWRGSVNIAENYQIQKNAEEAFGYYLKTGACYNSDKTKICFYGSNELGASLARVYNITDVNAPVLEREIEIDWGIERSIIRFTNSHYRAEEQLFYISKDGKGVVGETEFELPEIASSISCSYTNGAFLYLGTAQGVVYRYVIRSDYVEFYDSFGASDSVGYINGICQIETRVTQPSGSLYTILSTEKGLYVFDGAENLNSSLPKDNTDWGYTLILTEKFLISGSYVYSYEIVDVAPKFTEIDKIPELGNSFVTDITDGGYLFYPTQKAIKIAKIDENKVSHVYDYKNDYSSVDSFLMLYPNKNGVITNSVNLDDSKLYFLSSNGSGRTILAGGRFETQDAVSIGVSNGAVTIYGYTFQTTSMDEIVLAFLENHVEGFSIYISRAEIKFVYKGEAETISSPIYSLMTIKSLALLGEQTCDYLYVENGISTFDEDFEPVWGNDTRFLTKFSSSTLQAGQRGVSQNTMDIYRKNVDSGELQKLYSAGTSVTQLRDFSWITETKYNYIGYVKLDNSYTGEKNFNNSEICRRQPYYLLIEAKQIEEERQSNVYHVVNYWRFGNNVEAGGVSNNSAPNFLTNFTKYRLKQPTSRNSKNGVLSALLSNVENGEYNDTVEQMEKLYAASDSENTFFLKDMKGNLYMVAIAGAITQTINNKSYLREVKISVPWEEVGSCEGISIIQTNEDI